jgi:hypothetical protein
MVRTKNSKNGRTEPKRKVGYREPSNPIPSPLDDGQAYRLQQGTTLRLAGAPQTIAIAAAGTIALTINVSKNLIQNFNTRFANAYNEYRVLACDMEFIPMTTTTGSCVFFWDDKSTLTPVTIDANERNVVLHPNSNASLAGKNYHMHWRAKDITDLGYIESTAGSVVVTNFKAYTDTANFGTPAVSVLHAWIFKPMLTVEFRGIIAG